MDCELVDQNLVAFHFGETPNRDPVESHLLKCRTCLSSYLEIKRREEEADALGWDPPAPPLRWKSKAWKIPAAAAVAASLIWLGTWALRDKPAAPPVSPAAWAGAEPTSLNFF